VSLNREWIQALSQIANRPEAKCSGSSLLDGWARGHDRGVTVACTELADHCGVSVALVHLWRRSPAAERHRQTIEQHTGVPVLAWIDQTPAAEREREPEPGLPVLAGSPQQRLRTLEGWLEELTRMGVGLSTDRNRAVSALLLSLQGQVRAKPIPELEEHPDWPRAVELILQVAEEILPGGAAAVLAAMKQVIAPPANNRRGVF